jgi:hypothetical protein
VEQGLSLITSHDQYRRNPTEVKIKGQDYEFLKWALEESKRRKPVNRFRRELHALRQRYANPRKIANKLQRLAGGNGTSAAS